MLILQLFGVGGAVPLYFNPCPTKTFFVTWFTKGGGYHPPYKLEIDGPKV